LVIGSSSIGMESARRFTSVSMDASRMMTWGGLGQVSQVVVGTMNATGDTQKALLDERASAFQNSMNNLMEKFEEVKGTRTVTSKQEKDEMMKIKTQCIDFLIKLLFGRKKSDPIDEGTESSVAEQNASGDMILSPMSLSGGSFERMSYYAETESISFQTQGTVVTADGREINFGLSFEMSRSFEEYYQESYEFGAQFIDPLVINLDSNIADVSDQKFLFDIDSDGVLDNISELGSGSGYLSLDLNGDGIINDGSELFGTKSGDGFADLAKYDSDQNGWIDEADEIWEKLLIWSKDNTGNDVLYGLKDKGVGAIYLGNVNTDFSMNSPLDNSANAAIRKTGIFLYENGNAGTVQHLDVAR
jgi:hypothetical protein